MNLYVVKASELNMMFNKTFNLCYGKFMPKYIKHIEIMFYKEPSFLIPVNYTDIVEALNASSISHDESQDKRIKKLIANVNFGLLEQVIINLRNLFYFRILKLLNLLKNSMVVASQFLENILKLLILLNIL